MGRAGETGLLSFGKYRLIQRLGQGGMAEVWTARLAASEPSGPTVVVKRILPHLLADQSFVRMFLKEARFSTRLTHANVVRVFELGELDGEYYLAMEYVRGRDLTTVLRRRDRDDPLPVGCATYVAREVCRALEYAHSLRDDGGRPLGLIHRDVSPSNVMLAFDGGVKLFDFGIAKAIGDVTDHKTQTGILKGKLGYMAPEQVDGARPDHRADLFALAVVLHEMLTGQRLFKGSSDLQSLALVQTKRARPPSETRANVSPALDAIVLKGLAKNPDERYASAGEMAADLDGVVRELAWGPERQASLLRDMFPDEGARSTSSEVELPTQIGRSASSSAVTVTSTMSATDEPRRRRLRRLVAASSLGVLALLAVVWLAARPPHTAAPRTTALPASAPATPASITVSISSMPSGAEVYVEDDAQPRGRTPVTLQLPRSSRTVSIRLTLPGHAAGRTKISAAADAQVAIGLAALRPAE